jgi:hypothetical protein
MRRLHTLLVVGLLAVLPTFAHAAERITGIYSNLRYNQEAGDLIGMEVVVFPSNREAGPRYSAFVQIAEGGAPAAALVEFKEKDGNVEFVIPPGGPYEGQRFTGVFSQGDLVLKWPSGNEERLKRGKSYWQ